MISITPEPFTLRLSIEYIAIMITGGLGSIPGSVQGRPRNGLPLFSLPLLREDIPLQDTVAGGGADAGNRQGVSGPTPTSVIG